MSQILVRYKVKPDHAEANVKAVQRVYAELKQKAPPGFRYGTLRLADGVTFVHISSLEGDGPNPLTEVAAFKEFQAGLEERCEEPPAPTEGTIVGSYGIFD